LRKGIGIDRPVAAQRRRFESEPARVAADADETDLAFLRDLGSAGRPARGEPHVAAPQGRMAGKRQLPARSEYANAIVRARRARLEEKRRLAQVRPVGEARHPGIAHPVGADDDRERVAPQRVGGEDVYLLEFEFGQEASAGSDLNNGLIL
jgi:hypothetical protein